MDCTDTVLNSENCFTPSTINSLSNGILELYKPSLTEVKTQLNDLTNKQTVLIEQLHDENLKLSWSQNSSELQELFNTIKIYQAKLLSIKKDMKLLHDKSSKLKKRAIKLQQFKEKETYMRDQQLKYEEELISKPKLSEK